MIATQVKS